MVAVREKAAAVPVAAESVGGILCFLANGTTTVNGTIASNGGDGSLTTSGLGGGGSDGANSGGKISDGGGGAGGSVLLKAQTATLNTTRVTATKGSGGSIGGGDGSAGRIHLDYYTSYTGTTNPILDVTQDDGLVSSAVYQLRLSISSDGTAANSETQQ